MNKYETRPSPSCQDCPFMVRIEGDGNAVVIIDNATKAKRLGDNRDKHVDYLACSKGYWGGMLVWNIWSYDGLDQVNQHGVQRAGRNRDDFLHEQAGLCADFKNQSPERCTNCHTATWKLEHRNNGCDTFCHSCIRAWDTNARRNRRARSVSATDGPGCVRMVPGRGVI